MAPATAILNRFNSQRICPHSGLAWWPVLLVVSRNNNLSTHCCNRDTHDRRSLIVIAPSRVLQVAVYDQQTHQVLAVAPPPLHHEAWQASLCCRPVTLVMEETAYSDQLTWRMLGGLGRRAHLVHPCALGRIATTSGSFFCDLSCDDF